MKPKLRTIFLVLSIIGANCILSAQTFQWIQHTPGMAFDVGSSLSKDNQDNFYVAGAFTGTSTFSSFILTSSGFSDAFYVKYDATGKALWAKKGGPIDPVTAIAVDADGNSYVCGTFHGTTSFGTTTLTSSGSGDVYLVKLDSAGNFVWAQRGGGPSSEDCSAVALDHNGNAYLTGSFSGTAGFGSHTLVSQRHLCGQILSCGNSYMGARIWRSE